MKYCKHCGKQLSDNEICNCEASRAETSDGKTSYESSHQNQTSDFKSDTTNDDSVEINIDVDKIKGSFSSVLKSGINAFINPYSYGPSYIKSLTYKNSGLIMLISALITSIFTIVMALKINSGADGFFAPIFENYGYHENILPVGKSILLAIIFSLLISIILSVINFLANIIFKVYANFEKSMAHSALRSAYTIPVKILAIIVGIISPKYGLIIFFMSYFLVSSNITSTILASNPNNQNKIARASIVIKLLFFFIFVAVAKFAMSKMMTAAYFYDLSYQLSNLIKF